MILISLFLSLTGIFFVILTIYPYYFSKSDTTWQAVGRTLWWTTFVMASGWWLLRSSSRYGGWGYGVLTVIWALGLFGFILYAVYQYYIKGVQGKRTAGPRKAPINFRIIGIGLVTSLGLAVLSAWLRPGSSYSWTNVFRIVTFGLGLYYFVGFGKKFGAQRLSNTEDATDLPTGGVLFIRGFRTEREPFWYGFYTKAPLDIPMEYRQGLFVPYTFETFFSAAFAAHLGPLVGLANPMDTAPSGNQGMFYGPDEAWQQNLLHLLRHSKAIVFKASQSGNVDWELEQIQKEGAVQRFFIFTAPTRLNRLLQWFYGTRSFQWADFTARMKQSGYTLPSDDPELGAVIGFRKDGQGVVLCQGARTPEDYVQVMQGWLNG